MSDEIINELTERIRRLKDGYEGCCTACEPVGEMNQKLRQEVEQLRAERDEAWLEKGRIMNEIDCRIEHGADSNGHLEAICKLFSEQALKKMTRLDEDMGLL
jgi:archaellum component FlaC